MAKPTCFQEPLHIYQDDFFDQAASIVSQTPMPLGTKSPRKPLASANANVVINPPLVGAASKSPFKSASRLSKNPLTPLKPAFGNKLNMVPIQPPVLQASHTDNIQKKAPVMSRFKTVAKKPLDAALGGGKENTHPTLFPAPSQFQVDQYYQKPSGKRALLEAAPIKDSRPQKKVKTDDSILPPHDSFPPIVDDGTKPPHSYATLIGMAILRAPNRRLTLSQIYKWISDTFSFYNAQDAGWQNSIRHNLSLNKAFIKQERPKDDKGKGNYWAIEPGMEAQFMKEKPTRKSAAASSAAASAAQPDNSSAKPPRLESLQPRAPAQEPTLPPPAPKLSLPKLTCTNTNANAPELSSDATIPCPISDLVGPEDQTDKILELEAGLDLYSPLHAAIHSSPPIPKHMAPRSGTPPPIPRTHSSITRSHKRKFASMDDSGYISSLESSAMRPNQKNSLLASETDRPRVKRSRNDLGSAEAEIRRIRASSYDSPTKGRSHGFIPSSSPLRHDNPHMLPPLTPMVKFKAPPKPPPSVSPNTNLKMHRDRVRHMLQSPLRRASVLGEETMPWSPAFNLDNTVYNYNDFNLENDFDVFADPMFAHLEANGSPVKRSIKKSRLDRPQSASALTDITNSAQRKSITSAPFLKVPDHPPHLKFDTPTKILGNLDSPGKLFNMGSPSRNPIGSIDDDIPAEWLGLEDFQGAEFLADDIGEFGGLDILQGFEKIGGASSQSSRQAPVPRSKSGLERSFSTTF